MKHIPMLGLIASLALFTACGGTNQTPTPAPGPTLVITDNLTNFTTASGDLTFTFTFSEPIDASFNVSNITLEVGTKGTFTQVSSTVATLVAIPPPSASGTLKVTLAAGAFKSLLGVANTASFTATRTFDTGTGMILNGDFLNGVAYWTAYSQNGAADSVAVENGELKITVSAIGTLPSDAQVNPNSSLACIKDKNYRLTFNARADANLSMGASINENGHDLNNDGFAWSPHHYQTFELTMTMAPYGFDFTMPVTNLDAALIFFVGSSTATIYIDSVRFTEVP